MTAKATTKSKSTRTAPQPQSHLDPPRAPVKQISGSSDGRAVGEAPSDHPNEAEE